MKSRSAFTLVELVVVVMILGILTAVAAPKFLDTSATATETGLKQTLGVVRDAIEMYAAEHNGVLPAAVDDGTNPLIDDIVGVVGWTAQERVVHVHHPEFPHDVAQQSVTGLADEYAGVIRHIVVLEAPRGSEILGESGQRLVCVVEGT